MSFFRKSKLLLLLSLLFFTRTLSLFAEKTNIHSVTLSQTDYIYNFLKSKGFNPVKQPLVNTYNQKFPENITVEIKADSASKKNFESTKTKLVIAFNAGFVLDHIEQIINLLSESKKASLPYDTVFLFSADDENPLPDKFEDFHIGGTKAFVETVDDEDTNFAIVVIPSENEYSKLITGGHGKISPLWLSQTINHSCHTANLKMDDHAYYSSLYNKPALNENERLTTFLEENIAAVGIIVSQDCAFDKVLLQAQKDLSKIKESSWDKHYGYLPLGQEGIWINETFYTFSFFLFAIISLFIMCFFSFTFNSQSREQFKDVLKTLTEVPVTILITGFLLFIVESIFSNFITGGLLLFGFKFITVLGITFLIFIIQLRFNINISSYAYGYLLLAVSLLNVFIFSAADISFIYLFFIEFIIALFARKTYTKIGIFLSTICMILPYIFYFMQIFYLAEDISIYQFAKSGFALNILFAFAIYPVQMQTIRFYIATNLFSSKTSISSKKFWNRGIILAAFSLIFTVIFYSVIALILTKNRGKTKEESSFFITENTDAKDINISLDSNGFTDLSARHLSITTKENVLRYVIKVSSATGTPLYDSNYDYIFTSKNSAGFKIPDYPLGTIEIFYTADPKYDNTICVKAFIEKDKNTIEIQKKEISIEAWN